MLGGIPNIAVVRFGNEDVVRHKLVQRIVEAYRILLDKVAASPMKDGYVDLTHVFDGGTKLGYYADSVHPNSPGEKLLAEAVLPHVQAALASGAPPVPPQSPRCAPGR